MSYSAIGQPSMVKTLDFATGYSSHTTHASPVRETTGHNMTTTFLGSNVFTENTCTPAHENSVVPKLDW